MQVRMAFPNTGVTQDGGRWMNFVPAPEGGAYVCFGAITCVVPVSFVPQSTLQGLGILPLAQITAQETQEIQEEAQDIPLAICDVPRPLSKAHNL